MEIETIKSIKAERDELRDLIAAAIEIEYCFVHDMFPKSFLNKYKHKEMYTVKLCRDIALNHKGVWEGSPGKHNKKFGAYLLRTSFASMAEALDAAEKAIGCEIRNADFLRDLHKERK